jgi:hypothetical protein
LTGAADVVTDPVMVLITVMVHRIAEPPPLALLLHWLAEVVSSGNSVTVAVPHVTLLAAPLHTTVVTRELAVPVARFRVFSTVT